MNKMIEKKMSLSLEYEAGVTCIGGPMPECESVTIDVLFSDDEITTMKNLVASSILDKEAGLMPILEHDAPELYSRIDKAARAAILSQTRKKDAEIMTIYRGEDISDEDVDLDEQDVCDVAYICYIPKSLC